MVSPCCRSAFAEVQVGQTAAPIKEITRRWHALSPASKQRYSEKAACLSQSRQKASSAAFNVDKQELEDANSEALSASQMKRLGQRRVDKSLRMVKDHPVWLSGFGLADHISPLRADLVDNNLTANQVGEEIDKIFAFDRNIVNNTVTSADLLKPCWSSHGGLCCKSQHFEVVEQMMRQLQDNLKQSALDSDVVMLHFQCEQTAAASSSTERPLQDVQSMWALLGCTVKRPLSHVLMKLFAFRRAGFTFSIKGALPDVTTSQQLLDSLVSGQESDAKQIDIEAACQKLTGF